SDTHDAELPIYRLAADDPDEENTLATAVFTLDANHVRWQIFDINRDDAKFQGEVRG
ncbi:TPA: acyl-CoA--6-aminopenicillanic acid acyl-transferase, partial [Klebsiella michiganensis]|nr:acyl-CoA--6-aminopenicillanic acid acyl-transferase [Klebsiella michiganensis]